MLVKFGGMLISVMDDEPSSRAANPSVVICETSRDNIVKSVKVGSFFSMSISWIGRLRCSSVNPSWHLVIAVKSRSSKTLLYASANCSKVCVDSELCPLFRRCEDWTITWNLQRRGVSIRLRKEQMEVGGPVIDSSFREA